MPLPPLPPIDDRRTFEARDDALGGTAAQRAAYSQALDHFFSTPYDMLTQALRFLTSARQIHDWHPDADPATVHQLLDQIEGRVAELRAQWGPTTTTDQS